VLALRNAWSTSAKKAVARPPEAADESDFLKQQWWGTVASYPVYGMREFGV